MAANDTHAILLHDATLESLRVLAGGVVELRFDGVTVYRPIAPDLYETWIHRAKLVVSGLTRLLITGPAWTRGDDDYVLNDTVVGRRGEKIHWADLNKEGAQKIELLIFSGARIELECSAAKLTLSRKRFLAGQWKDEPERS